MDHLCTRALEKGRPGLSAPDRGLWRAIQSGASWDARSLFLAGRVPTPRCPLCDCTDAGWRH
eukprot:16126185-Heterocapsa_arctica.AAC.1